MTEDSNCQGSFCLRDLENSAQVLSLSPFLYFYVTQKSWDSSATERSGSQNNVSSDSRLEDFWGCQQQNRRSLRRFLFLWKQLLVCQCSRGVSAGSAPPVSCTHTDLQKTHICCVGWHHFLFLTLSSSGYLLPSTLQTAAALLQPLVLKVDHWGEGGWVLDKTQTPHRPTRTHTHRVMEGLLVF